MVQSAVISEPVQSAPFARGGAKGLGMGLGVCIGLYPFADLAMRPRISMFAAGTDAAPQSIPLLTLAQTVIVVISIIPILAAALRLGVDFRRSKLLAAAIFMFALSIPLSFLSMSDLSCFMFVLLIDYVIGCAILLDATNVDRDEMIRSLFSAVAVTLGFAMVAVLIDNDAAWGRLFGRTAPDYWGHLALSTIVASFAMRGWLLRTVLVALSLFVIFKTQSRSDMMALSAGLPVAIALFTRSPRARRWTWLWFVAAFGVVVTVGLGFDFISNDLLKLSDPLRGLDSGFTGRSEFWRETWEVFANHPWFGVGYGQHANYVTNHVAAHSVYLAALADTGVVGFLGYAIFFFGALARSLVQAWRAPTGDRIAISAFLFAFAVVGLLEPTGFHTGNTFSMLMIFVVAWAWRTEPGVSALRSFPLERMPGRTAFSGAADATA